MPAGRPNVVDSHDSKMLIVKALLTKQSHAKISREFGVSLDALRRYQKKEMCRYVANGINPMRAEQAAARAEQDGAVRDLVMSDISAIRDNSHVMLKALMSGLPENGKLDCDAKSFAVVARELRGVAELDARLQGRLQDTRTPQINVVVLSGHNSDAGAILDAVARMAPMLQPGPAGELAPGDDTIDAEDCSIPPGS